MMDDVLQSINESTNALDFLLLDFDTVFPNQRRHHMPFRTMTLDFCTSADYFGAMVR